jgi:CRP/FNR family cyclic AMP-dependent transcriptional regulator
VPLNDLPHVLAVVGGTEPFKSLPPQGLLRADALLNEIHLKKGQWLFQRGDGGGALFVVIRGTIEISATAPAGNRIILNYLGPGECLGEISLLDGQPRSANAAAASACHLVSLPAEAVFDLNREYPEFGLGLARLLVERVRWLSNAVDDFTARSIDCRLARRLLIMSRRFADSEGVITFSQGELAEFAGTTRESANRILKTWHKKGWIMMARRTLVIRQRGPLEELANTGNP